MKNLVRERREALGWSRWDLGVEAGVQPGLLIRIERAEATPRLDVAAKLACALGSTLGELWPALATQEVA